ncbi:hypothetical protein [Saccharothrix sp. NRRL B-16314]|uniref:hypothetical protein n=1 Tax=Saccharothrix sp. NRRL B-16314 TaxID=1463825 RepID=UPI0012DD7481|nr:hypothetical protein [Saccharothrix sp. NRRL B-16314]
MPGALWGDNSYVDPVTKLDCESLALCSPVMATLDPELVRRLWPMSEEGVTRSMLAVLGATLAAYAVEPKRARRVVESEPFRASPTPVVVLPLPAAGLMVEFAVFVLSSADELDEGFVLPPGGCLPLPPVVIEGHEAQWLVSPAECEGLMTGPELARLLTLETSNRR